MIVFGAAVPDVGSHRSRVEPGIRLAAEADSVVLAYAPVSPMARAYNLILDEAATIDGLDALVLVHPRTEVTDPALAAKVRAALSDPDVAVAGCAGARGVRSMAWWAGDASAAPIHQRYDEHGGGEVPAFAWADPTRAPSEVDAVDAMLLALSPWAVRNLRFDEALGLEGYDVDICLQARAAGRKVVTAPIEATVHRSLDLIENADRWMESHSALTAKWFAPDGDGDDAWRPRARRAEAECEAARISGAFVVLAATARIEALEDELAAAENSVSWRVTAPLRALNRLRARLLGRPAP